MKKNLDIRAAAKAKGIFLWEIAEALGTSDTYFSKLLRKEFSPEQKKKVFRIMEELRRE